MKTPENGIHRIKMQRPFVRADVYKVMALWRSAYGIPYGRVIDAMYDYIKDREDFKIPGRGIRKSLVGNKNVSYLHKNQQLTQVIENNSRQPNHGWYNAAEATERSDSREAESPAAHEHKTL